MSASRRSLSPRLLMVLVGAVVTAVALLSLGPWPVGSFQDDGMYLVLAKSLATGHGYRYLNLPGQPVGTHFPPGYPALLALLWRLSPEFPANVPVFKFVNALLLGGAAAGAFHLARMRLGLSTGAATVAAVAGSLAVPLLALTGMVLSEPLFLACLFPALALAERAIESEYGRMTFLAGMACGALAFVRSIGIVAVAALILVLLLRRRWRDGALAFAGAAIALAPWQVWMRTHAVGLPAALEGKYGDYTSWALRGMRDGGPSFVWEIMHANARDMAIMFGGPFSLDGVRVLPGGPVIQGLTATAMLVLLAVGLARVSRRASVVALFAIGYLAFVIAWPFAPHRFVWTIWPLLAVFVAGGAMALPWRRGGLTRLAMGAALGALLVACGAQVWYATTRREVTRFVQSISPLVVAETRWVARHTRPTDVVASDLELAVFLYTDRPSVPTGDFRPEDRIRPFAPGRGEGVMRDIIETYDARWVVMTNGDGMLATLRLTRSSPPVLRLVGTMPAGAAFARVAR